MDGLVFSSWKINVKEIIESRKTAEDRKCQGLSFIVWEKVILENKKPNSFVQHIRLKIIRIYGLASFIGI